MNIYTSPYYQGLKRRIDCPQCTWERNYQCPMRKCTSRFKKGCFQRLSHNSTSVLQYIAEWCRMLRCFSVCSVCYRVLQHVPTKICISRCKNGCYPRSSSDLTVLVSALQCLAVFSVRCVWMWCSVLQFCNKFLRENTYQSAKGAAPHVCRVIQLCIVHCLVIKELCSAW